MTAQPTMDQARAAAFMGTLIGDLAGTMATVMCVLGDLSWPRRPSALQPGPRRPDGLA